MGVLNWFSHNYNLKTNDSEIKRTAKSINFHDDHIFTDDCFYKIGDILSFEFISNLSKLYIHQ